MRYFFSALTFSILFFGFINSSTAVSKSTIGDVKYTKTINHGAQTYIVESNVGKVRIWIPKHYNAKTGGIVVFMHGYHYKLEKYWKSFELPKKFKKSELNAIFIAPELPTKDSQKISFKSYEQLMKVVKKTKIKTGKGPVVLMGYSGGYRNILAWIKQRVFSTIIMLDAFYGGFKSFKEYMVKGKKRKMILLGGVTDYKSKAFAHQFIYSRYKSRLPGTFSQFTKNDRKAKILYIDSQFNHYQIIKNNNIVPLLLRLSRIKTIK
jgi:hypothetical protein